MKAEQRKGEVILKITEYADLFVVLPMDSVCVVVTNMDMHREWTEAEFITDCDKHLGINDVVYSSIEKSGDDLLQNILKVCSSESYDLNINSEMFLRMFKFHDSNRKTLKVTSDIKTRFKLYKDQFDMQIGNFSSKDRVNLFFEFKVFMTEEVKAAKEEMMQTLGFDFVGEDKFLQAGHLANMVNQIQSVIYDVRMESLQYQSDHGAGDLRKCPHCGMIWAKVEGCEGRTTCGEVPSDYFDVRDRGFSIMATFTFRITNGKLIISRTGERSIAGKGAIALIGNSMGCKKSITWSDMQKVPVPKGFHLQHGDVTEDILCLPSEGNRLAKYLDKMLNPKKKPNGKKAATGKGSSKKLKSKVFR